MSINLAIDRAFEYAIHKHYDKIYIALDLHGVCLQSNYSQGGYTWLNDKVVPALQYISHRSDIVIILFSSCHKEEQQFILQFFKDHHIKVDYFNENPECKNTQSGCFDSKFYYSIIIDDKAGFDPNRWHHTQNYFSTFPILGQE
jgi:hypothetical protein